jgi:uncharacterized membrane protein YgdD (TMEM256/DUF423 family)
VSESTVESSQSVSCQLRPSRQYRYEKSPKQQLKANSSKMSGDASDFLLRSAAFLGSTGVGAGAFGAHALKSTLEKQTNGVENWKTAVMYQLIHATALLALSALSSSSGKNSVKWLKSGKLMGLGSVIFSGSIYCLTLNVGPKKVLGPITPIGGLLMIGGWAVLGLV